tara:strand:- start:294 stop:1490 length:1197 start_codon:yes stop_codon:yes gene_type:complete
MSLAEQGNMLLAGGADANESIRAENRANFEAWQSKKKQEKEIGQGQDWYHGVSDVLAASGFAKNVSTQAARAAKLNVGYAGLASHDIGALGSSISAKAGAAVSSVKATGTSIAESARALPGQITEGARSAVGSAAESIRTVGLPAGATAAPKDAVAAIPEEEPVFNGNVPDTVQLSGGGGKGVVGDKTVLKPAEPAAAPAEEPVAPAEEPAEPATVEPPAPAEEPNISGETEGGGVASEGDSLLTDGENLIKEPEAKGISSIVGEVGGRALGNIGGGIDIVKDFSGALDGDSFFSGGNKNATTGDQVANFLAVSGTALDIASIALPFLAPVAAAVSIAGAVDGTVQSVSDQSKSASTDKTSYESGRQGGSATASLAGTGFLASAQIDPHKSIGGSSSF